MSRVLIVDDEPAILSLLSLAFRRAGYDVQTTADPYQAIKLCDAERFDALLSDVQMPGMDGHYLVRWIAGAHPEVKSVLMSAYDIECGDCPLKGRCKLLRKPFAPTQAISAVAQAIHPTV